MSERELTPHQAMAKRCNLHPNALSVFQRLDVVPRDVDEITEKHVEALQGMSTLMADPVLLGIQLKRLSKGEREQLVEHCSDAAVYKNWERRAIRMFTTAYQQAEGEGEEVTISKVLGHLQKRLRIQPTPYIKFRLNELRRMVAKRVKKEGDAFECGPM